MELDLPKVYTPIEKRGIEKNCSLGISTTIIGASVNSFTVLNLMFFERFVVICSGLTSSERFFLFYLSLLFRRCVHCALWILKKDLSSHCHHRRRHCCCCWFVGCFIPSNHFSDFLYCSFFSFISSSTVCWCCCDSGKTIVSNSYRGNLVQFSLNSPEWFKVLENGNLWQSCFGW